MEQLFPRTLSGQINLNTVPGTDSRLHPGKHETQGRRPYPDSGYAGDSTEHILLTDQMP